MMERGREGDEFEKMLAGELYDAGDPELVRRRIRARRLTREFNASREGEEELRTSLLAELLGGVGTSVLVEPPFYSDFDSQIHLGDHVAVNLNCVVLDCAAVRIGDHTLISPSVQIYRTSGSGAERSSVPACWPWATPAAPCGGPAVTTPQRSSAARRAAPSATMTSPEIPRTSRRRSPRHSSTAEGERPKATAPTISTSGSTKQRL